MSNIGKPKFREFIFSKFIIHFFGQIQRNARFDVKNVNS
jgi:hypothetical protein